MVASFLCFDRNYIGETESGLSIFPEFTFWSILTTFCKLAQIGES
jgi:hypothetical protein